MPRLVAAPQVPPGPPVEEQYEAAYALYEKGKLKDALKQFKAFVKKHPEHDYADNSFYWMGEVYYDRRNYKKALKVFSELVRKYPQGNKAPDALLKIALSYMSLNRYSEGCQMLNDLQYRYPNSEPAQKAYRWRDRCGYWGGGGYTYIQPYSSNRPQPWYSDSALPKYW